MSDATPATALAAEQISAGYDRRTVLADLSVGISRGTVTALVGPNGSGKSTLLKTLARLLQLSAGAVYLDGKAIARMPTAAVARTLAGRADYRRRPAGYGFDASAAQTGVWRSGHGSD